VRLIRVVASSSLVLLLVSGTACQATGTPADTRPIVIGADLELSGVDAPIGTAYQRALQLRIDELNASGGVGGRHLQLLTRDNRGEPGTAVADVSSLAGNRGVAALVMGICSACTTAVAKVIDGAHLPTVSLAPAPAVVRPVTDHRYVFKLGPDAEHSAAALAPRLHGVRRVALLCTDDVDGSAAVAAFSSTLSRSTTTVVSQQLFRPTDTDLNQPVHAALLHSPDALLVSAFPGQAAIVAKTARESGYTKQIFFDANAAGDLFLTGPGSGATDGAIMAAPQGLVIDQMIATSPGRIAGKRWFADYTARYGTFSGFSTYAADAVRLITDAIGTAGGVDRARMRDAMEKAGFDGLSGQIRFTPDDHSGVLPQALTMVVARSGRWRPLA
jgi:branched-chain amino acid transport system substrate-binding protein